MSYPQDPNYPYGPADQGPADQNPQYPQSPYQPNPYPPGQYGPPGQFGPPADPQNLSAAPTQLYGPSTPSPYEQPAAPYGNPYDTAASQYQQQQPYGQPPQPYGAPQPGFTQQPYYGQQSVGGAPKKSNSLMLTMVAVAVVVGLCIGGYFVLGKSNNSAQALQTQTSSSPPAPAPTTPTATAAPTSTGVPAVTFTPPSDYTPDSLATDPGCTDYDAASTLLLAAPATNTTEATQGLNAFGEALQSGSSQAVDPTLAAALSAEGSFFLADEPALAIAEVANSQSAVDAAWAPIAPTDTYVSTVCGSSTGATTPAGTVS